MSFIVHCDAPACPIRAAAFGGLPAGWLQANNTQGWTVHAHDATHLAAAQATTGNPALLTPS